MGSIHFPWFVLAYRRRESLVISYELDIKEIILSFLAGEAF